MSNRQHFPVAPKLAYASTGLEPYIPSAEQPWNEQRAAHLLRRTLIGPTPDEIAEAVQSTPEAVVDRLLAMPFLPPNPPAAWVGEDPFKKPNPAQRKIERERVDQTRAWWMSLIVNQGFSIQERMVLFWHDHFATQAKDVRRPQWMYLQNFLFRKRAVGNFKTLVQEVTRDPAMIYYLDSNTNKVGKPNENYARELMELFTMGEGNAYTERDIGEAARALTGWIVVGKQPVFRANRFDKAAKTFLGQRGNFNDRDIIDIIFEQPVTAEFICGKLYREFVYEYPDPDVVAQLAQLMRDNDYEIEPVLKALLLSAHFFDPALIGAKIKSPVELVAGTARSLGFRAGTRQDISAEYLVYIANVLGQKLLDPPNVAGWPGYRLWISTSTLPDRHKMTDEMVDAKPRNPNRYTIVNPDVVGFVKAFPAPYDAEKLVNALGECLTPFPVDEQRREMFLDTLLEGADVYDWDPDHLAAPRRIKNILKLIFELPDYQLN